MSKIPPLWQLGNKDSLQEELQGGADGGEGEEGEERGLEGECGGGEEWGEGRRG